MTPLATHRLAVQICLDALHSCAGASPEAEFAAMEAFAAVHALGIETRHSHEPKPAKTWVAKAVTPQSLFP